MYTGTLIDNLMTTVERTERRVELKRCLEEPELHQLFELPVSGTIHETIFAGAA